MYTIIECTGASFAESSKIHGQRTTFQDAYDWAIENICADIMHEGSEDSFWFSDEKDPNVSYKVNIVKN